MLIIGLTGGIGSGKTAVSNCFYNFAVPVIDTDIIAAKLVGKGQTALKQIIKLFGSEFLQPDGELNRKKLARHVFLSKPNRLKLESILHPAIKAEVTRQIQHTDSCYCIIVIPLLFESGFGDLVNRVLVIDSPVKLQIQRVAKRDQRDLAETGAIIQSQLSRKKRLSLADDVIKNNSSLLSLKEKVKQLHQYYLDICKSDTNK